MVDTSPYKRAIQPADQQHSTSAYRQIPVDCRDPRFQEPLVRISLYGLSGESYYARRDGQNAPYFERIDGSLDELWARRAVAEKLSRVNDVLRPYKVELFVWDAYRPIACQYGLWSFFEDQVSRKMPQLTKQEQKNFVLKYVSDPTKFDKTDYTTWPVHSTGGAIDLTLRDLESGILLNMGANFDEMGPVCHSDHYEKLDSLGKHELEVRNNRRLLHWAMHKEGFTNYPMEYWHFDWGDQMYVLAMNELGDSTPQSAWYGYVESPVESVTEESKG